MASASTSSCSSPAACIGGTLSLLFVVSAQKINIGREPLLPIHRARRAGNARVRSGSVSVCRPKATALRSRVEEAALAGGTPASVPVRVAHELLQAGHRYLDVRTPEEFNAGHASGAINIPYMYRVGMGVSKNPNFVKEVLVNFRRDDEIIVGCESGKRSMMAAKDLLAAGFYGVVDIAGGYSAWTKNGLPTD